MKHQQSIDRSHNIRPSPSLFKRLLLGLVPAVQEHYKFPVPPGMVRARLQAAIRPGYLTVGTLSPNLRLYICTPRTLEIQTKVRIFGPRERLRWHAILEETDSGCLAVVRISSYFVGTPLFSLLFVLAITGVAIAYSVSALERFLPVVLLGLGLFILTVFRLPIRIRHFHQDVTDFLDQLFTK